MGHFLKEKELSWVKGSFIKNLKMRKLGE